MNELEKGYEVIKRIKKIKEGMHSNFEKLFKELNLTGPQAMVVGILFKRGPLKVSELSNHMGLSMSTVSGILDRLERSDFITREKSESDGRVIMVDLKKEFRESSTGTFCRIEKIWSEKLNKATEDEIEVILHGLEVLDKLLANEQE